MNAWTIPQKNYEFGREHKGHMGLLRCGKKKTGKWCNSIKILIQRKKDQKFESQTGTEIFIYTREKTVSSRNDAEKTVYLLAVQWNWTQHITFHK